MSELSSLLVSDWLQTIKLDQYSDLFEKHDIRTVSDVRNLSDEFLTSIGIHLPGHRKRILASMQKSMSQDQSLESAAFRPVPKKRNILPKSVSEQQTSCPDPIPNSEPSRRVTSPPPIPPRSGRRCSPLTFSTGLPKSVSPVPVLETATAEEPPRSPVTPNLLSLSSSLTYDESAFIESDGSKEEVPMVGAPPLPQKRHKLENKSLCRSPPPLPARPTKAPAPPSSPSPAREESKGVEDQALPLIPKPLPRVFPRDPSFTPIQPPPRDGPQKPEIRDPDLGSFYELSRDIDGIALTGFRRLNVDSPETDGDLIRRDSAEYEEVPP
ncbi:uncharacterized protein LOC142724830, partial [Rhinoderma darwinii]|uniref:uncharacterized protein LOC142724830 n=1 Tax=Rhinoderma darwinii TaxID=43563 RepID=UPI003F66393E